jgi:hypothetical protein
VCWLWSFIQSLDGVGRRRVSYDYIDARLGQPTSPHARSAHILAFSAMQRASPSKVASVQSSTTMAKRGQLYTVHLLSCEGMLGIFGGVAARPGFLVGPSAPSRSDIYVST